MEPRDRLDHGALLELAELAALEGLEPEEHRQLAEHLDEGCSECAERYARGVEGLDVLALATPTAELTPGRREALLEAIGTRRAARAPRRPRRDGWRVAIAAVAAGVALALAIGSLYTARRVEHTAQHVVQIARAQLEARLAERDQELEALSARLARFEQSLEVSGQASIRALTLDGEAGSSARVVVDRGGNQVLLLASRLPPAPPGHTYQLWVIVSGAPRSLGVFDADDSGRALHVESERLDLDNDFSVAVSVEPSGGVPQPTGPIVLASH